MLLCTLAAPQDYVVLLHASVTGQVAGSILFNMLINGALLTVTTLIWKFKYGHGNVKTRQWPLAPCSHVCVLSARPLVTQSPCFYHVVVGFTPLHIWRTKTSWENLTPCMKPFKGPKNIFCKRFQKSNLSLFCRVLAQKLNLC